MNIPTILTTIFKGKTLANELCEAEDPPESQIAQILEDNTIKKDENIGNKTE